MNKDKKLKIAVIGTRGIPATYGGVEKHCEEIYSRLVKEGCDITIYSRSYYNQSKISDFKGVKIKTIPILNIKGFESLIHSFISTILATFSDVDIIHFHSQGPSICAWIPRLFSPKKKVGFTCHGIDWKRDKWNIFAREIIKAGEFFSARSTHFRIAVSQYIVDYYKETFNVDMDKIYNGVNCNSFLPLKINKDKFAISEKNYIIFVGRLVPEKAPDILIKAVKNMNTDIKLLMVGGSAGTDSYVEELKTIANGHENIVFTSYMYDEELQELYSNALAYVSTSKLEGLPLTALEAMSYSLPVLLSNIEPHKEIYSIDNSIGYLFDVNSVEECQKTIETFLTLSEEEYKKMGRKANSVVKKVFNWDIIVKKTKKVYERVLIG